MSRFTLYNVAKINSRGQLVLPKDARTDFSIVPGDKLVCVEGILKHSQDVLLLMKEKNWNELPENSRLSNPNISHLSGTIKVADYGQIVIPKRIREKENLQDGFKILILSMIIPPHSPDPILFLAFLNDNALDKWLGALIGEHGMDFSN